jgi:hypothetical protein
VCPSPSRLSAPDRAHVTRWVWPRRSRRSRGWVHSPAVRPALSCSLRTGPSPCSGRGSSPCPSPSSPRASASVDSWLASASAPRPRSGPRRRCFALSPDGATRGGTDPSGAQRRWRAASAKRPSVCCRSPRRRASRRVDRGRRSGPRRARRHRESAPRVRRGAAGSSRLQRRAAKAFPERRRLPPPQRQAPPPGSLHLEREDGREARVPADRGRRRHRAPRRPAADRRRGGHPGRPAAERAARLRTPRRRHLREVPGRRAGRHDRAGDADLPRADRHDGPGDADRAAGWTLDGALHHARGVHARGRCPSPPTASASSGCRAPAFCSALEGIPERG